MADRASDAFAVRPATPADVPDILRLIRELAIYEKLEDQAVGTDATLHAALFGERPSCEALVATRGPRAVGFALYFTTFSTFLCKPGLYLEDLFVEEDSRGLGIGKALLAHLAGVAARRGCGRFEWRVLDWNEPSIRFYESLGATLMPSWILVRMTSGAIATLAQREATAHLGKKA